MSLRRHNGADVRIHLGRWLLGVVVSVMAAGQLFAQNTLPAARFELFGGYELGRHSFHEFPSTPVTAFPQLNQLLPTLERQAGASGYQASLQFNVTNWMGLMFNATGSWSNATIDATPLLQALNIPMSLRAPIDSAYFSYMAGPQFVDRRSRHLQPFGRLLVGGVKVRHHGKVVIDGTPVPNSDSSTEEFGFGYGAGGGADFTITPRLSVRGSVDYVRSNLFATHQSNIRLAIGAVFHFGGKRGAAEPAVSGD